MKILMSIICFFSLEIRYVLIPIPFISHLRIKVSFFYIWVERYRFSCCFKFLWIKGILLIWGYCTWSDRDGVIWLLFFLIFFLTNPSSGQPCCLMIFCYRKKGVIMSWFWIIVIWNSVGWFYGEEKGICWSSHLNT